MASRHLALQTADWDRERKELATEDESERNELAAIYASRGGTVTGPTGGRSTDGPRRAERAGQHDRDQFSDRPPESPTEFPSEKPAMPDCPKRTNCALFE